MACEVGRIVDWEVGRIVACEALQRLYFLVNIPQVYWTLLMLCKLTLKLGRRYRLRY